MANDDTILREVDQELAEERQWAMFRRHGAFVIGGALAIVLGVAGWQLWNAQKDAAAKEHALEFRNALEVLDENVEDGQAALTAVAEEGGGYGLLAKFYEAASYASEGERAKALEVYRGLYNDSSVSRRLREFARLRAAHQSLADGRDAVISDLGDLPQSEGPFAPYAREISALAALGAKDYETAHSEFTQLSLDNASPETVRSRAEDFAALAAAGRAGVNITGETRLEDLIGAVGEDGEPQAVLEDGHDHDDHDETVNGAEEGDSGPQTAMENNADASAGDGAADDGAVENGADEEAEPVETENE